MATMTVSEARARMREALERVKRGEELEITQNGEVVAVWLHPSKLRYRVRTPAVQLSVQLAEELRAARRSPFKLETEPTKSENALDEAEAHIREIRADRDDDVWSRVFVSHETDTDDAH